MQIREGNRAADVHGDRGVRDDQPTDGEAGVVVNLQGIHGRSRAQSTRGGDQIIQAGRERDADYREDADVDIARDRRRARCGDDRLTRRPAEGRDDGAVVGECQRTRAEIQRTGGRGFIRKSRASLDAHSAAAQGPAAAHDQFASDDACQAGVGSASTHDKSAGAALDQAPRGCRCIGQNAVVGQRGARRNINARALSKSHISP